VTGQPTTPATPATPTQTGSTTYYSHYRPVMHGFWYDRLGSSGYSGAPIYRDRDGYAYSGRNRVGQFSSAGSFTGTGGSFAGSSRRGGFGGSRSVAS
jgi:hypothetical protein